MADETLPDDQALPAGTRSASLADGEPPESDDAAGQPAVDSSQRVGATGRHARPRAKRQRPFIVELLVLVAIALAIALVVHTFLFQAFFIPSGSMENTLHVGDRVLVNRLSYRVGHVQRGQIIVFNGEDSWTSEVKTTPASNPFTRFGRDVGGFLGFAPSGEHDFIKRVIGVPGDHVQCCNAQGELLINGKPLQENYLASGIPARPTTTAVNLAGGGSRFDIIVPPGRVWVEGDHRDDSADSRAHLGDPGGGTIPESKIIGRAFVIVWPVSHWRWLSIPASYHQLAASLAAASPMGSGVLLVAPLAGWRRRRARRRRSGARLAPRP